jgi:hypothetical protein
LRLAPCCSIRSRVQYCWEADEMRRSFPFFSPPHLTLLLGFWYDFPVVQRVGVWDSIFWFLIKRRKRKASSAAFWWLMRLGNWIRVPYHAAFGCTSVTVRWIPGAVFEALKEQVEPYARGGGPRCPHFVGTLFLLFETLGMDSDLILDASSPLMYPYTQRTLFLPLSIWKKRRRAGAEQVCCSTNAVVKEKERVRVKAMRCQ